MILTLFKIDLATYDPGTIKFELSKPFPPLSQLLGVLPPASRSLLPAPYRQLMVGEGSELLEYYPADFKTDMNGKKRSWEAIVLIPFIEEEKLVKVCLVFFFEMIFSFDLFY